MTAQLRLFVPCDDSLSPEPHTDTGRMTAGEVIDWFLARYTSTSREALTEVRRILRLFGARYGAVAVSDLVGDDLISFVESQPRVKKAWTIARWYRTIKHPFNEASRLKRIPSPFENVRQPRGDRGRDLSPREFGALLRRSNPFFRRVLLFMRYSGARPGEVRAAKWDDVVWTAKGATIVLREHKTKHTQKKPKPRKIFLVGQLVKLLLWMKRSATSAFVFTNSFGNAWSRSALCKMVRRLRAQAGLGKDVKLHGCRHMFATQALLNRTEVAVLQKLLGHERIETTMIYEHLDGQDDFLAEAAEKAVQKRTPSHRS